MRRAFGGGFAAAVVIAAGLAMETEALDRMATSPQAAQRGSGSSPAPPTRLSNTDWRLVEFQSMDDATGTIRPKDPSLFHHLTLMADGGIFAWEPQAEIPFETAPDKGLEAAILKASPSYTRSVVGTDRARYVYGRVDLNGDGRDEVFVYLLGSAFCGTGGCNLLLFTGDAKSGYTLVNEFPISRLPVSVSPTKTAGWHDLFRQESGGGAKASYVRHAFDGKKYAARERTPADTPPAGRRFLAGELSFDKGVPLEPRGDNAAAGGPAAPAPSKTGFSTVCGVTVNGKEYRYKCTVEGAAAGTTGTTVLKFPDNTVTFAWLGGNKATATFAGMVPQPITISTADGTTRFTYEDRLYFFVSDRAAASALVGGAAQKPKKTPAVTSPWNTPDPVYLKKHPPAPQTVTPPTVTGV